MTPVKQQYHVLLGLLWLGGLATPAVSDFAQLQSVRAAIVTLKQGHRDSAEAQLRRLILEQPRDPLSQQALGTLHLSAGRLDSARRHFQQAVDLDSTLAESHHGVAIVSAYASDWSRAFERFGSALDLDPGNPVFHYNAGIVYDHLGRLEESEAAFRSALLVDPWNDEARRYLASVLLYQNEPDEALEQYAAACRLAPTEAKNWYGVGRVQARLGADSLATVALERACQLDTSFQKAVYNLSLVYRRLGRTEDSRLALERSRLLQDRQGAIKERVELKMADPDPARVQFRLAGLYSRRGRPSGARARLLRARRLGLEDRDAGRILPTETMPADRIEHLAGLEFMKFFEYPLAISHYRAAVDLAPEDATHRRGLGLALVKSERYDEAIIAYRESLRQQADLCPALNDLALVMFKERADPEQAIALMEEAVRVRPEEKIYRYNLGHILHSVGRFADAASRFEQVLALDSTSALTLYSLGVSQIRLGQHDHARQRLLQALVINPEYGAAYFELAQALEAMGDLDEAVEAYRSCLRLEPLYKYAHYGLGQALAKLGRVDESQPHLERFAELPDHKKPEFMFYAPPDAQ